MTDLKGRAGKLEKLVTVATFSHPEEAYLGRARLQSEGIWSFVADDNMVTTNWLYSNAIGGVKLRVRESDAQKATQVLRLQEAAPQPPATTAERCPKCNSPDVHYERFSLRPLYIFWLISFIITGGGMPLPFLKRKWKWGHVVTRIG